MLIPIILSGGTGSRLWPVSREAHPKPFIKLDGQSLLQRTFARASSLNNVTDILTVTNRDYYFKTKDEYADSLAITRNVTSHFLLEPQARNTAPAIALAALYVQARYGKEAVMVVMAADHLIEDQNVFANTVYQAYQLAQQEHLVTFGIRPTKPETGYGYIEYGASCNENSFYVKRFVEKPDLALAQTYVASKQYLWNSGLFCFKAASILEQLNLCAPELYQHALYCWKKTLKANVKHEVMLELDLSTFLQFEDISIDYAVMEKAKNVLVIPGNFGWNDIGSWEALSQLSEQDNQGNQVIGESVLIDVKNTYIHSDNRLVAAVGLENLFIVDTQDALLIARKDCAQEVKKVVSHLKTLHHASYKLHRTVTRPWGSYTILEEGSGFKIKRIEVRPGAKLSLQMHQHRSEHWIVVEGVATVTNGEKIFVLRANESTYVPMGHQHRLENASTDNLVLIEVQSGAYLDEDDIVRFEDQYGRVKASIE